jgi:hypothetical protein
MKLFISGIGAWLLVVVARYLVERDTGSPLAGSLSVVVFVALWVLLQALWDGDRS